MKDPYWLCEETTRSSFSKRLSFDMDLKCKKQTNKNVFLQHYSWLHWLNIYPFSTNSTLQVLMLKVIVEQLNKKKTQSIKYKHSTAYNVHW